MFYISVMIILCDYYRYTPFDINTRFALLRDAYGIVLYLTTTNKRCGKEWSEYYLLAIDIIRDRSLQGTER